MSTLFFYVALSLSLSLSLSLCPVLRSCLSVPVFLSLSLSFRPCPCLSLLFHVPLSVFVPLSLTLCQACEELLAHHLKQLINIYLSLYTWKKHVTQCHTQWCGMSQGSLAWLILLSRRKKENPPSQSLQISFKIRYELLSMYILVGHVRHIKTTLGGLLLMSAVSVSVSVLLHVSYNIAVFARMRTNWLLYCWPTEMASHGHGYGWATLVSYTSELRLVVWNPKCGRLGAADFQKVRVGQSARELRDGSTITRELYAVWKNRKWLLTSPSLGRFPRLKFARTVSPTVFRFSSQERLPSLMGWRQVILTIQHYLWFWRCSFYCICQKHIYTLYIILSY